MADDPFDLDEDEDSTDQPAVDPKQNAAFAQMRKEKKALEKENAELRAFREEQEKLQRVSTIKETFTQAGLQPDWAEFYQGEEVTPEAARTWAITKKLIQPEENEVTPEPVAPPSAGFTPTVIAEGSSVGSKFYDAEEFAALMREDPKKAERVYQAGRLKKEEAPWTISSRFYGRDT